ncbi:hypothetical protein TGAM01_v202184 [Trichoderma gamsii]|uniref:Uncharacterized protein n=1 Tax=Trichoderma gamsii TaxID=398673 RepID=A0A2P4ZXS0_9HYPO|nr:hypothetical protein TGAM01_v202184 [Trichoderma gamsii]PON29076.1 hypothetical protein TGAM01_v202184 [Trichoderma gamsii]
MLVADPNCRHTKKRSKQRARGVDKAPGQSDTEPRLISFKEQVEQLVLDNTRGLDEIEDTYKEEIQAESLRRR